MESENTTSRARRCARRTGGRGLGLTLGLGLCLVAGAATAIDTTGRSRRELVPTGTRATIHLDAPTEVEDTVRELRMEKGKSVFVRTGYPVRRVSVGSPEVADVLVLHPQELQIVAREVGATNIVLWSSAGQIEAAIDLHVGRAFSNVESEIRRVMDVGDVRVDSAGDSIVLTGSVPDAASLERVLALSRAYFPEKAKGQLINLVSVGGNQQVMIEVVVSEMSRNLRKAIGTNLAATITRNGDQVFEVFNMVGGLTSVSREGVDTMIEFTDAINFIGTAFPIGSGAYQLFVNALDETGLGKVLAEPTLVARTGETAHFLAGGEIAILVSQGGALGSITTEFKEFGVGIEFTPTVLSGDRIHLDVTTEVSELDFGLGTAVGGITTPGFRTRRASTGVEVGDGQAFAIAGMLRDDLTETVSQYPILGSIPILGTLFRSSAYQKRLTELVVLVRPRLVRPLGADTPPLPSDYLDEPNDFEFYLLGRAEGFDHKYPAAEPRPPEAGLVGDAGYRLPATHDDEEDAR